MFKLAAFAPSAGGWISDDRYPRLLADVNGDGKADIVGFADGGVLVSLAEPATDPLGLRPFNWLPSVSPLAAGAARTGTRGCWPT